MHNKLSAEPVVLFANPPSLQDLCAITVTVTSQVTHSQVASTWQPQILKCREIIFTEPDIIATPAFDMENSFNVVLQQSLFKTGKLQNRFQKIGLEASKPYRVTPALYQSSLRYTLLAKVAPTWNKAGEWMVQGRDFLTHTGYANAIKMNLTVNRDELFVSLLADCVKFPPLQLIDLDVDEHFMRQLMLDHPSAVRDMTLFNCWCHVLPSMKRGRICSVSKTVPQEGPFRSYKDLKRHWKNTYGYRLPDTEDDVIFYEISFRQNGGKLFTYPSVCLRATQMQRIPRIDPKPILTSFIQDLHSKLASICGHQLKFLPKVRYAVPELYECGQERNGFPPNLSNKNLTSTTVPLRNIKDLTNMYTYRPPAPLHTSSISQGSQSSDSQCPLSQTQHRLENSSHVQSVPVSSSRTSYDASRSGVSMAALMASHESFYKSKNDKCNSDRQTQIMNPADDVIPPSQNSSNERRIIPVFKTKALKGFTPAREVAQTKAIPIFKPKPKPVMSQNHSEFHETTSTLPPKQPLPYPFSNAQPVRTAPSFAKRPVFATTSKTPMTKHPTCHDQKQSTPQISRKICHTPSSIDLQKTPLPTSNYNRQLQSPSVSGSTDHVRVVTGLNSKQSANSLKRPVTEDEGENSVKKQRAKPQIQDVDVEMSARAHQLNKVNSVTLLAWLKQKKVPCKAKDKKADLILQVYHMLNLQTSET